MGEVVPSNQIQTKVQPRGECKPAEDVAMNVQINRTRRTVRGELELHNS
jgi:hypothetical protein